MKKRARRREIRISVCLPAAVTAIVRHVGDDDWEIESIRRIDCEASPRAVGECMKDEDFDGMYQAIEKAKDLP